VTGAMMDTMGKYKVSTRRGSGSRYLLLTAYSLFTASSLPDLLSCSVPNRCLPTGVRIHLYLIHVYPFTVSSPSIRCLFTVYPLSVHCLFAVYSLSIHCLCIVYSLSIHCLFTVHSLSIHCLSTVYSLSNHCVFTVYPLSIHWVFTVYSLSIHCPFTVYLLSIHCLFTVYSLSIHCIFTVYSLSVHCVFTVYSPPIRLAILLALHCAFAVSLPTVRPLTCYAHVYRGAGEPDRRPARLHRGRAVLRKLKHVPSLPLASGQCDLSAQQRTEVCAKAWCCSNEGHSNS
jgi:hypothetical protein